MIHTFNQNGFTLVVDVYSGSVHVVDEQAAELIRLRENASGEETLKRFIAAHPEFVLHHWSSPFADEYIIIYRRLP